MAEEFIFEDDKAKAGDDVLVGTDALSELFEAFEEPLFLDGNVASDADAGWNFIFFA
ncbi:hypothetical protein [Novosphingobium marinum]|uniref:Uncharacterized protein n=1 Tax=Novosphingobium marinum TaxID=1514948 RepID=A0A7Y9XWX3_9SPHN|nr:hypothetical protein [Novosphingobium marinum]NYH96104.1 hypothetical protein [Novosphingobium marinum]